MKKSFCGKKKTDSQLNFYGNYWIIKILRRIKLEELSLQNPVN